MGNSSVWQQPKEAHQGSVLMRMVTDGERGEKGIQHPSSLVQRRCCANRGGRFLENRALVSSWGFANTASKLKTHRRTHAGAEDATYREWICSCRRASSDRWKAKPGSRKTWRPRRRGRGCGTLPECLGGRSEKGKTHTHTLTELQSWHKNKLNLISGFSLTGETSTSCFKGSSL